MVRQRSGKQSMLLGWFVLVQVVFAVVLPA
jgi:hypothetical protein